MKTIKARTLDLSVNLEIGEDKKVLAMKDDFVLTNRFMQSVIKKLHETEVNERKWLMLLNGEGDELDISDTEKESLLNDPPTTIKTKIYILSTIYEATIDELQDMPNDVITNLWDHVMGEIQEKEKK